MTRPIARALTVGSLILCPLVGCKDHTPPTVTQPAVERRAAPAGDGGVPPHVGAGQTEKPRSKEMPSPKRPEPTWVIFSNAIDEKADANCLARWTGEHRLEIRTENIQRLTLDLHKLPQSAPRDDGPWNLQIDGQGIDIAGLRGGRRALDLVRSRNGDWTVVPGSHRMKP